jgi:hypothetical protein
MSPTRLRPFPLPSSPLLVVALASLTSLTAVGCAGRAPRPVTPAAPGAGSAAAPAAAPDPVTAALRQALASGRWEEMRIDAECRRPDGSYPAVTVFGSGVGLWQRERQFELTGSQVRELLVAFWNAGFAALGETQGGTAPAPATAPPPATGASPAPVVAGAAAPTLTCSVALQLGGVAKRVNQLATGRQSAELARLAGALLDACEAPGRAGATAASLTDGLRKVAAGELAPEVLRVDVQRTGEGPDATGWLLALEGGVVTGRGFQATAGYGEPRQRRLSEDEVAALARLLIDNAEGLPFNLYADQYTDLTIEVLNHKASIQARRFAGMTPETHGPRQQSFDRVIEVLTALQRQVAAEGRAAAP